MRNNIYNRFFTFFGLKENPFSVSPDPRYLFVTRQIQVTLDALAYGIQIRKGIILLTGEVGTGKTTVINRLLDRLHKLHTPTAFIFNSQVETRHVMDFMLADFGVPLGPPSNSNRLTLLNQWLFKRYSAGETPVLIVDEAQGLPIHVLEEIRVQLNSETRHEKLLQIVLAGQPELDEKLKRPELCQLKEQIAIRCKTAALCKEETRDYIEARLQIAGSNGKQIFTPQAIDAVDFYSHGIPRVVNLLCEHTLINAYADDVQLVPALMVEEAAHEFQFDENPLAPSLIFRDDPDPLSITEQSVEPELSAPTSREVEPFSTDRTGTVATIAPPPLNDRSPADQIPDQPHIPLPELKEPVVESHSAVISNTVRHRLNVLDGPNKNSNSVIETNVTSSRQLITELSASQPPITRASVIRPAEARRDSVWGGEWHRIWAHMSDKCNLRRLAAGITSRVSRTARQQSVVLLRPTFGCLGAVCRDTGLIWQRSKESLVLWLQQPLVKKQRSNPRMHIPLTRSLGIRSTKVTKEFDFGGASRQNWEHVFAQHAFGRLVIDAASQVACSTRRLSGVILRRTVKYGGTMWQDAGPGWKQTKRSLVRWLQRPQFQKQCSNARVLNPPPMVVQVALTFLRQLHRSWYGLRNNFPSAVPPASFLSLKVPLLRWLREPIRPFRLRHSGPR